MNRIHPQSRFYLIDFLKAILGIGALVASGIGMILNAAVILFLLVSGLFILSDDSYITLFRPWVVVCGLYLMATFTYIAYRLGQQPPGIVIHRHQENQHNLTVQQHFHGMTAPSQPLPVASISNQSMHQRRGQVIWLQAGGQMIVTHLGNYAMNIQEQNGVWYWQITQSGRIRSEGIAGSLEDAKQEITACLADFGAE